MLNQFNMLAAYNRWANNRVTAAARHLSEAEYREDKGAFFGSMHGTLNHILAADQIWLKRFTGVGDAPPSLDTILCPTLTELEAARSALDTRIIDWIANLTMADLTADVTYTPMTSPIPVTHPLAPGLTHVFNHQTHHRGQAHMILTALGKPSITLDLISFVRADGVEWLRPNSV
ncbi:damage-inducible protein DinB [Rhizobium sp. CFBP 8762]|uniref:DinB family protein n=1 Tax=Rhizobium sp. CFBP 8762 TaxID=2775279 RepID=UPI001786F059|nr:DinB family protein [Rhizobium sp. CFBP 8762]MBD8553048.1 damage-inducible protein DinB [Rhizobium sp. CFBP 8762]